MQITVENPKPKFEPVTLTVKFESESELKVFQNLMGWEITIPKVLLEKEYIEPYEAEIMETMMRNIFTKLRRKE